MKPASRRFPALCMIGFALAALTAATAPSLRAHGSEARYVVEVDWTPPRIARTYGLSYSELGLGAYRNEVETRTVGGRRCVVGGLIGFDVDDAYAFDVDESVTLTLTYAPALTTPFTVVWDRNGGDGLGRTQVQPEAGEADGALRSVTLTLDRARLAGHGTRGIDIAAGSRDGLVVCDVEVTRSGATEAPSAFGRVRLEITDRASGRPVPARVGLYDATGRLPLPSDDAVLVHRYTDEVRRLSLSRRAFWPSPHRQAFYVHGGYEARVPAGTYELVVTRGIEYRVHHADVEVGPGETATVPVALERYADQPAQGWYSGDAHIHIERDTVRDENVWAQVAAEDVHVANLLQMGNVAGTHFGQPAWGAAGRFERAGHALVSGQEDPRTVHRGHTIHHNLQRPLHVGPEGYFLYHRVFEESRRQGGVSGYAHQAELFNGRRGIALDVPFGIVDFVEILQQGRLPTDLWYGFLDLGYKLLPAAGSDFPYMDLPGVVRSYVHIDGPFGVDAWFDAFRAGRLYVTNGPLLEVTANGATLGAELHVEPGAPVEVVAEASLNPDLDRLDRLELVVHGEVVAVEPAAGRDRVRLRTTVTADRSLWLAVRAFGERQEPGNLTIAHSAPVYVIVAGRPFYRDERVPELVALQRARLQELLTEAVDPNRDLEPWETRSLLSEMWPAQRRLLEPRVEEADARYRALLAAVDDSQP